MIPAVAYEIDTRVDGRTNGPKTTLLLGPHAEMKAPETYDGNLLSFHKFHSPGYVRRSSLLVRLPTFRFKNIFPKKTIFVNPYYEKVSTCFVPS
jgi:hypothetical protein